MVELALKILAPVAMIGLATLAGHRWGPAVAGILAAIPSKAGPILVFLAIEQGNSFAATSATASLGGTAGTGFFCLAYALTCHRTGWPLSFLAACAAFSVVWLVMVPVTGLGALAGFVGALISLFVSRRLMPAAPPVGRRATAASDLPLRMVTGAVMVVFVTTAGPYFGATISGMITTIPTIAAVLAVFTHAQEGPDRTVGLLAGMIRGQVGLGAFLFVFAATILPLGLVWSMALATLAVVAVQAVELRAALRARKPEQSADELVVEAAE
jgi:hypothetical protein